MVPIFLTPPKAHAIFPAFWHHVIFFEKDSSFQSKSTKGWGRFLLLIHFVSTKPYIILLMDGRGFDVGRPLLRTISGAQTAADVARELAALFAAIK